MKMRLENKAILERQIEENKHKRFLDEIDRKELVRTNFGPEETDEMVHGGGVFLEKKIND